MVKPKKKLGQHFLIDENISQKVANVLDAKECETIIEIGAGTGALSVFLWPKYDNKLKLFDIDEESITYLKKHYPERSENILFKDFLSKDSLDGMAKPIAVIGNFPYNISSQIVFKILDNVQDIPEWGGMFQKEVAKRIAEKNGSKVYGILSVLVQAYYKVSYEFTVPPGVFNPPPKVDSGVLSAKRYRVEIEGMTYLFFKEVVKTAFNQRRKTLSNALGKYGIEKNAWEQNDFAKLRAEQLGIEEFISLALFVQNNKK